MAGAKKLTQAQQAEADQKLNLPTIPTGPPVASPEIDINDIKVLYQLALLSTIKVSEINIVKPTLDKVEALITMK